MNRRALKSETAHGKPAHFGDCTSETDVHGNLCIGSRHCASETAQGQPMMTMRPVHPLQRIHSQKHPCPKHDNGHVARICQCIQNQEHACPHDIQNRDYRARPASSLGTTGSGFRISRCDLDSAVLGASSVTRFSVDRFNSHLCLARVTAAESETTTDTSCEARPKHSGAIQPKKS